MEAAKTTQRMQRGRRQRRIENHDNADVGMRQGMAGNFSRKRD